MTTWHYLPGAWNVHCDVCGFKFKSTEIQKRWDGLMVCKDDFELDHPQKYLRVKEDRQTVPFVRHQSDDNFLNVCYIWGQSGYAGLSEADCWIVENTTFTYQFLFNLKNASFGAQA